LNNTRKISPIFIVYWQNFRFGSKWGQNQFNFVLNVDSRKKIANQNKAIQKENKFISLCRESTNDVVNK